MPLMNRKYSRGDYVYHKQNYLIRFPGLGTWRTSLGWFFGR